MSAALQMLEPLDDFDAEYDGEILKVRAGAGMFFSSDHEVVRRFPHRFGQAPTNRLSSERVSEARAQRHAAPPQKPAPARVANQAAGRDRAAASTAGSRRVAGSWILMPPGPQRSRSSATYQEERSAAPPATSVRGSGSKPATGRRWWLDKPDRPEPETVPVYFTKGSRPLRISHDASAAIRRECERWGGRCETGGALLINREGSAPKVFEATVDATSRAPGEVSIDRKRVLSNAAQAREWPLARLNVSTWHTHPGGTTDPSPGDCESWARLLDESKATELFELIVTKH
jgi:proteasome lid subunit RPN8/RPN11